MKGIRHESGDRAVTNGIGWEMGDASAFKAQMAANSKRPNYSGTRVTQVSQPQTGMGSQTFA